MEKSEIDIDRKEKNVTEKDKFTDAIGEFGRWHIYLFLLLSAPVKMTAAWTQMGIVFLAPKTTFRCLSTNLTDVVENSTCYSDCEKYEYFSEFVNSIISEWDLICDRSWLANFAQTASMFGVLVGSVVFGFIADRYGRRPSFLLAAMLHLTASFVAPLCPDYWTFIVIRFLLGTAAAGTLVISFVLLIELTGAGKRELMSSIYHVPLAFGQIAMAGFAYYLRTWNSYSLGVAIPNLLFLICFFVLPESPKWLITTGNLKEAVKTMKKAAQCNGLPTDNIEQVVDEIFAEIKQNTKVNHQKKATYWDLIRNPTLRYKNLCSCIAWFILGISFYGGNQYIGQTSSNAFLSMAMAGTLQIPGILSSGYLCKRFGRRAAVITYFLISAISNALLALPDTMFTVKLIAGSVGVSCGAAAFVVMYMYTSELFPTVTRNMAMGSSSTLSRVGSMLAPFIAGLGIQSRYIPPGVFATMPLIAAGVCCFLPETKGKKMEDCLEES